MKTNNLYTKVNDFALKNNINKGEIYDLTYYEIVDLIYSFVKAQDKIDNPEYYCEHEYEEDCSCGVDLMVCYKCGDVI